MQFPFNTLIEYFKQSELKHINEFIAIEPKIKHVYKNGKDESRMPDLVKYPIGTITPQTAFMAGTLENGSRNYHTPCAKIEGSKEAIVYYWEKDERKSCTSKEWIKWLGQKFDVVEPKPKEISPAERKKAEAILKMHGNKVKAAGDEMTKGANWVSPKDK